VGAESFESVQQVFDRGETKMDNPCLGIVRDHLSADLLFAAFNFAKQAQEIESQGQSSDPLDEIRQRSVVIGAIVFSTTFLEATVNELFQVACDKKLGTHRLSDTQKKALAPIWGVESFRRARVLEKYQVALELSSKERFVLGEDPYQSAKLLFDLRNAIIHYVPDTNEIRFVAENDLSNDIEKKLRGRFALNKIAPPFPVVSRERPNERASYPFFPTLCLGYGCAKWAATGSRLFADDFFRRIDVKWHYDDYLKFLPTLE
jgi:hypothetical protein